VEVHSLGDVDGNTTATLKVYAVSMKLAANAAYHRAARFTEFAISHYFERNSEQAAKICREGIRQFPTIVPINRFLLASLGQLGRQAECEALVAIAPAGYDHFTRHRPPWFGLKDFGHMLDGLRKAGWSE
jgi:hypothetical protein